MPHTLAEKILLEHADADDVRPGDVVMVRCDVVMANDVSGPVAFRVMEQMGASRVFDPAKVVMVADHFMPAKDARSAELQRRLKEWSDAQGVTFFGQGRGGIEHTLLCEEGWVVPGSVIAGGDSHTCTYGALGAFGSGFGSTDIAACLAFGEFWQAVPATIQVELTGRLGPFVAGKDVILAVIGEIGVGGATNCCARVRRRGRRGALGRRAPGGRRTWPWRRARTRASFRPTRRPPPTSRAERSGRGEPSAPIPTPSSPAGSRLDLSSLEALVAKPHLPGNVVPVSEVAGTRVDQAYIGNCANGTMTDLRQTAEVLRGNRVHPDCRLIVVPATQRIYREALAEGLLDVFVEAGAMVSTPTCGACFGGGMGVLAAGRAGRDHHEPQLPRPHGLARGRGLPRECVGRRRRRGRRRARRPGSSHRRSDAMIIEGRAVVIPGDDVDTDVMYPGQFLNIEDPELMKAHLFEGYDPALRDQLGPDTIIVTGANFGLGSSREHVVQAMKAWGVRCLVGASFARILRRNAVNLGLPVLECAGAAGAARPGSQIRIDTDTGEVDVDGQVFRAQPVPAFVVDLACSGGLVPWAREQLGAGST